MYLTIVIVVAVVVVATLWRLTRKPDPLPEIQCSDGPRRLVDTTQFETKYWAYSVKLETTLSERSKVALELDPKQRQQLSEALQQANEFRKWLVNSYNACAVTNAQYSGYEANYTIMDNLARRIQETTQQGVQTPAQRADTAKLVDEYIRHAQSVGDNLQSKP